LKPGPVDPALLSLRSIRRRGRRRGAASGDGHSALSAMHNRQILYDFQNCRYHSGLGSIEASLLLRPVDGMAGAKGKAGQAIENKGFDEMARFRAAMISMICDRPAKRSGFALRVIRRIFRR
jgi:hypothetical protein